MEEIKLQDFDKLISSLNKIESELTGNKEKEIKSQNFDKLISMSAATSFKSPKASPTLNDFS